MEISQLNSKTIYVVKEGIGFLIQYFYNWNGIKKEPESVILKSNAVSAFFLTSVIRDSIEEIENGFYIERKWHIIPGGELSLSFCIDLVLPDTVPFLVPCMLTDDHLPRESFAFSSERLSHPSSVFFFPEEKGIHISADLPVTSNDFSSLCISRARTDKYHCTRVEISLPPYEKFPATFNQTNGYIHGKEKNSFNSSGDLQQNLGINILISKGKEIYPITANFIHKKLQVSGKKHDIPDIKELITNIKHQIDKCLGDLLHNNKGIFGILEDTKTNYISLSATIGLSLLIQMLYKSKTDIHETSLKLADFCLKAQHPAGIFFNKYYLQNNLWFEESIYKNLKDQNYVPAMISIQESAIIVNALLLLSQELKAKDYFYNAYFSAALRFIDFLIDSPCATVDLVNLNPGETNVLILDLLFPLFSVYQFTGIEKYKTAIISLKNQYFPDFSQYYKLPSVNNSLNPDFNTALMLLKAINVFSELGIDIPDKEILITFILPWIYYNKTSLETYPDLVGGIIDSFDRCRLVCRGYETAYHLLKFYKKTSVPLIKETIEHIVEDIVYFAMKKPAGLAFINHTLWSINGKKPANAPQAPFNSQSFVNESFYLLKLIEEFPEFINPVQK